MLKFIFFAGIFVVVVSEEQVFAPFYPQQPQQHYGGGYLQQPQPYYGGGYAQQQYNSGGSYGQTVDDGFQALTFPFQDILCEDSEDGEVCAFIFVGLLECAIGGREKELLSTHFDRQPPVANFTTRKRAVVTDQCIGKDIGYVSFRCDLCFDEPPTGPLNNIPLACEFDFQTDYGDFKITGDANINIQTSCDFNIRSVSQNGLNPRDFEWTLSCPNDFCEAKVDKKFGGEIASVELLDFHAVLSNLDVLALTDFNPGDPFLPFNGEFFTNVVIDKKPNRQTYGGGQQHQPPNQYTQQQPWSYQQAPSYGQQAPSHAQPSSHQYSQNPIYQQHQAQMYGGQNQYSYSHNNQQQQTHSYGGQNYNPQQVYGGYGAYSQF